MPEVEEKTNTEEGQQAVSETEKPVIETQPAVNVTPEPEQKPVSVETQPVKTQPDEYYKGIQRVEERTRRENLILKTRLQTTEEQLAALLDAQGKKEAEEKGETYTPVHTPKVQQQRAEDERQSIMQREGARIERFVKRHKIPETDPRLAPAIELWKAGKFAEASDAVEELTDSLTGQFTQTPTPASKPAKPSIDPALLRVETTQASASGTASGGSRIPTEMDAFRQWVNDLPYNEYKKREKEIDEALASGRIK